MIIKVDKNGAVEGFNNIITTIVAKQVGFQPGK